MGNIFDYLENQFLLVVGLILAFPALLPLYLAQKIGLIGDHIINNEVNTLIIITLSLIGYGYLTEKIFLYLEKIIKKEEQNKPPMKYILLFLFVSGFYRFLGFILLLPLFFMALLS